LLYLEPHPGLEGTRTAHLLEFFYWMARYQRSPWQGSAPLKQILQGPDATEDLKRMARVIHIESNRGQPRSLFEMFVLGGRWLYRVKDDDEAEPCEDEALLIPSSRMAEAINYLLAPVCVLERSGDSQKP
jgi:hypothetical protein